MGAKTDLDRDSVERATTGRDGPLRISKDDAFHILQNARRRAVLRYLTETDRRQFVMGDLAEEVAAWEHGTTVARLDSAQRQRVYISLYQSHLPKLADHDIIEYDQHRGTVEPTELVQVFEPYLGDGLHAEHDLTVEESEESGSVSKLSSLFRG